MSHARLQEYAFLWDGSKPEWCLHVIHRNSRRLVLVFGSSGPTASDVVAMRAVFEELRARPAAALLAEVKGRQRIELQDEYSIGYASLCDAAHARGLKVEVLATNTDTYLPVNTATQSALLIEDDQLLHEVVMQMLAEDVPRVHAEAD